MRIEAPLSGTPETTPLTGVRPPMTSDLTRIHRFNAIPLGGLPGSEIQILTSNLNQTESRTKQKSTLNAIGRESYNPREQKPKGYRDKNGMWIIRRRGSKGYRCRMTDHEKKRCPTPERCQNPKVMDKGSGEARNSRSIVVMNVNSIQNLRRKNKNSNERSKAKTSGQLK